MKAMVLKAKNSPFVLETVPDPVPGPGEAVARVLACGAGLTIHHTRAGRMPVEYPRIIGHEITGEIVAVGSGVTALRNGDAVTAYYYLTCGHCHFCRINRETLCDNLRGHVGRDVDGGYAEYIKLEARSFIKLPPGLDWRRHPGGDRRDHRRDRDSGQGRAQGARHAARYRRGVRRGRRARRAHAEGRALGPRAQGDRRGRDGLEVRDLRESGGRCHGGRLGWAGRRAAPRADRRQGRGRRDRFRVRERHPGGCAEGARQGRALRDARRAAASRSPSIPPTSCARRRRS